MTTLQKWQLAELQAIALVCLARRQAPEHFDPQAVSCGGQDSSGTSSFARVGTTKNFRGTSLPNFLQGLLQSAATTGEVPSSVTNSENNFLSGLLSRDNSLVGKNAQIDTLLSTDPTQFTGRSFLESVIGRNPFSTQYETATNAKYLDTVGQAVAAVRSGPDAVRGGTARNTLREAEVMDRAALNRTDEVRRAQAQDAGLGMQATNILAAIEAGRKAALLTGQNQVVQQLLGANQQGVEASKTVDGRRQTNTGTLLAAGKMMGIEQGQQDENIRGVGAQQAAGTNWNAGIDCCFIFLEALNGELPWYVRKGRDEFNTPARRTGYVRMSRWLVPAMRKSKLVTLLVNEVIVRPFLVLGRIHYSTEKVGMLSRLRWLIHYPYCWSWFGFWSFSGRKETK